MVIINTVSDKYFTLDGVQFAKIYQPLAQGSEAIGIYSIFDTKKQILNSTKYDEIQVDGVVYASQSLTIQALLPAVYVNAYEVVIKEEFIEKKYIVAGVIRNEGAGWFIINDANHKPININSISLLGNDIKITHSAAANLVGTLICTPDETFAREGYSFGASVGANSSTISLYRQAEVSGYFFYNGSAWETANAKYVQSVSWEVSENSLRITTNINIYEFVTPAFNPIATGRGVLLPYVRSVGTNYVDIGFTDYSGVVQTVQSTDMKVFFSWNHEGQLKASEVSGQFKNIWIYGLMES